MSTSGSAGLRAVTRVRSIREQDSRFGLQQAMSDADHHRRQLEELDERLGSMANAQHTGVGAFLATRSTMLALGSAIGTAQQTLSSSTTLAVAALTHWQHDKVQLEAIELLQERRAQEVRDEENRLEARDLDETASQLWRRHHGAAR